MEPFDAPERLALIAEWKRQAAEPLPPNLSQAGCLAMLAAVVLFAAIPPLTRALKVTLPPAASAALIVLVVVLLLGGLVMSQFGGTRGRQKVWNQSEAALTWLAAHGAGGAADQRRRAAVTVLLRAYHSDGPTTSAMLDVEAARTRLGAALPYVMDVERALIEELKIYPVFTGETKAESP